MNTMIIYSSKYGSTADCAQYLKSSLSGSISLLDIDKRTSQSIDLEKFDTIVIGSSIYVGAVSKKIRDLCIEHADELLLKKVGIFLCCGFSTGFSEYLSRNFSAELIKNATVIENFGGEARLDKMKLVDKLIMKAATKGNYNNMHILQEHMDDFVKKLSS